MRQSLYAFLLHTPPYTPPLLFATPPGRTAKSLSGSERASHSRGSIVGAGDHAVRLALT